MVIIDNDNSNNNNHYHRHRRRPPPPPAPPPPPHHHHHHHPQCNGVITYHQLIYLVFIRDHEPATPFDKISTYLHEGSTNPPPPSTNMLNLNVASLPQFWGEATSGLHPRS